MRVKGIIIDCSPLIVKYPAPLCYDVGLRWRCLYYRRPQLCFWCNWMCNLDYKRLISTIYNLFFSRRHPDSNWGSRICNPLPYHLAIPPFLSVMFNSFLNYTLILIIIKGNRISILFPLNNIFILININMYWIQHISPIKKEFAVLVAKF